MYVYVCVHVHIHHIFFFHSSIHGHLGSFCAMIIVNNAAVSTEVQVYFQVVISFPPGRCSEVELLGHRVSSIFNTLRKLHTVSPQWPQQSAFPPPVQRVPLPLHPHRHLLFPVLLILAILTGVRYTSLWFRFAFPS